MKPFAVSSATAQVAAHLREEILRGTWVDLLPGSPRLAEELGVGHSTISEALAFLEHEGLLVPQGTGKRRMIRLPDNFVPPSMRIRILPYEDTDRTLHFLLEMQHGLQDAGHSVGFAPKSLHDLGMDAKRVARFVADTESDAWIIVAGPRGVLEWFAQQPVPAFSIFGRRRNIPIGGIGPDKLPALLDTVERLVGLGHQRIVFLLREEHRKPKPGFVAQALLDAMNSHGLKTGPYNLPDWEDNAADLRRCLDSLFHVTPPSALVVDESFLFNATLQHLARNGIIAPRDVSLVCADPDPAFEWLSPSIAHIRWDSTRIAKRVLTWANNAASGKDDRRQSLIKAEFVEGGTIGPAPRRAV